MKTQRISLIFITMIFVSQALYAGFLSKFLIKVAEETMEHSAPGAIAREALEEGAKREIMQSAPRTIEVFGEVSTKSFLESIPKRDAIMLTQLAEKTDSMATKKILIQAYKQEGSSLFERLSWKQIAAYGLTAAAITGTYQLSRGGQSFFESSGKAVEKSPSILQKPLDSMSILITSLSLSALTLVLYLTGVLSFFLDISKKIFIRIFKPKEAKI